MGTLVNYVRWRGDLSFKTCPLTAMDAVVLGQICYFDLRNAYIPKGRQTLGEVYDKQLSENSFLSTSLDPKDEAEEFLRSVDASKRFRSAVILDYTDIYKTEEDIQFAAMTLSLDDGSAVVIFRGTDDSLAGWKEDLMISFTLTESQRMALDYLKEVLKKQKNVYVCGHSKGGNLALYSSCLLSDRELSRIKAVYLNDAPGLSNELVPVELERRVSALATVIRPEDSVIGRIFEPELSNFVTVKTKVAGIMAHSGYSWLVEDNDFVKADGFSKASDFIHDSLEKWLENKTLEERRELVDGLFGAIKEAGYERLSDFKESGFSELFSLFAKKLGQSTKDILADKVVETKDFLMDKASDARDLILDKVEEIISKAKK